MVNDLLLWFGLGAFITPASAESGSGEKNENTVGGNDEEMSNIESLLENELSVDRMSVVRGSKFSLCQDRTKR